MLIIRLIAASTLVFIAGIALNSSYDFMSISVLEFFQSTLIALICYDILIYLPIEAIHQHKKKQAACENSLRQPGYHYQWLDDETGMAFNIDEGKLLLHRFGRTAVYPRSAIRSFNCEILGIIDAPSKGLRGAVAKSIAETKAEQRSGFTFELADVNCPEWFVHCSNEYQMKRYFEIITQFMEGSLQKPAGQQSRP